MINIAQINILEGKTENALEIWRVLQDCPVEYKIVQEEGSRLLADLQAQQPNEQFEAGMRQGDDRVSLDREEAAALAYALEYKTG
jgi:hypothetical protein